MSEQTTVPTSTASPDWPNITQFYSKKDVFVTGATGFLGKCLVEKLIRSIPDLGRVMILIRPKRGKSVKERLDALLGSKLFDLIRNERPSALDKVIPICGECGEPGMGIGESDQELLTENVSVIFHLAATIKFDEPLRHSLTMNVLAVQELIKLGRRMKKLASFVHVSSAYAHCNRKDLIEEIIYPPKVHPDKVLALLDWMTDDQLDLITPSLIDGRPNTYTYTKSLAEYVLTTEAKDLPVAIYRPSIVSGSAREPYPGWVDCIHGPTGIIVASGKGLLRVMKCQVEGVADMVPVDMVNNCMISIGWITGLRPSPRPLIYQYTSGTVNPFTWHDLYHYVTTAYNTNPFDEMFRRPYIIHCRPPSAWKVFHFFLHLVPGFLFDCLRRLQGKKPVMMKVYGKLDKALAELNYFLNNSWKWSNTNSYKLFSLLSPEDQEEFDFDIRKLNWSTYFTEYCLGTKRYLFNEDPANLPIARKQIKRFRNIRMTFNFVVFLIVTRLLYIRSQIARNVWSGIWQFCIQILSKLGLPLSH